MRDSSSPKPLSLKNLEEDSSLKEPERFYPFFEGRPEEVKIQIEKDETQNIEEEIRKTFEEAYRQGEKAGYEMGMKKAEAVIKRFNSYLSGFEEFKKEMTKKAERLAFEIAFAVAEAIVLKECSVDKSSVLNMIKKALELCEKKSEVVLKVRTDDYNYIISSISGIRVEPDETLKEPGFVIESNFGIIDGTLKTQIEELKREISKFFE
ncbi:MAG: FliH/SctL family protein [Desulfobacterota bacterium]|nr:FliH/SctL family protein [Thermodesulfobacteriota bacterium]MDW8002795.1 FliH/SctL family protein [Deltaproteobacteria bacterium]